MFLGVLHLYYHGYIPEIAPKCEWQDCLTLFGWLKGIIGQLQNSMHVDTQQAASLYQYARTKSWPEDTLEEIPQMRNNVDRKY